MRRRIVTFLVVSAVVLSSFCSSVRAQNTASLPLKDAIPVADAALAEAHVALEGYWLYGITFGNSSRGSYWYFVYRPTVARESQQIYVKVYMNRSTEISGAGVAA